MTHTAHTTGIIDVGGGFRAIFGAGVEDRCLEEDVGFDHCYGISAGSANLASDLARQQGRAHTFYTQYAFRKEYASMENYITKRNFCDLDYVYGTLSNSDGENPLDYAAFSDNPATFTVVAANGEDGSSRYFDKSDMRQDDYTILKASSAVPVACQPVVIDDVPYFDGGIAILGYSVRLLCRSRTSAQPLPHVQRRGRARQAVRAGGQGAHPLPGKPLRALDHVEDLRRP